MGFAYVFLDATDRTDFTHLKLYSLFANIFTIFSSVFKDKLSAGIFLIMRMIFYPTTVVTIRPGAEINLSGENLLL